MFKKRFPRKSVAGNARVLNVFSFWACLHLYWVVAVLAFAHVTGSYALAMSVFVVAKIAQMVLEVPTGIVSERLGRVWRSERKG
jgi:predicted anti-sigma-YlaC factor YlaD